MIHHTELQDVGLKHLGGMKSLAWAHLDNTNITDASMLDLSKATTLKRLSLRSTNISDYGLKHLEHLTKLESLDLVGTKVTAQGVARLKQALPNCDIDLNYGLGEVPSTELLFPEHYQPDIEEINAKLRQWKIKGDVQEHDSSPENRSVTLRLFNTNLSDQVLLSLVAQIPDLKRIYLHRALLGDNFLKGLRGKKIRQLSLESTRITDEGLRHVAQLPKLERLALKEVSITDKGLAYLHRLSNLERLELHENARITSDGLKQFNQALPNCVIYPLTFRK